MSIRIGMRFRILLGLTAVLLCLGLSAAVVLSHDEAPLIASESRTDL
jgi:hypothetical protein